MNDKELQKEEEIDEDNSSNKQNNNSSSNGVRIWKLENKYSSRVEYNDLKEAIEELNQNYSLQLGLEENNKDNVKNEENIFKIDLKNSKINKIIFEFFGFMFNNHNETYNIEEDNKENILEINTDEAVFQVWLSKKLSNEEHDRGETKKIKITFFSLIISITKKDLNNRNYGKKTKNFDYFETEKFSYTKDNKKTLSLFFLNNEVFFSAQGTQLNNNQLYKNINRNYFLYYFFKKFSSNFKEVKYYVYNLSDFSNFINNRENNSISSLISYESLSKMLTFNERGFNNYFGNKFAELKEISFSPKEVEEYFGIEKKKISLEGGGNSLFIPINKILSNNDIINIKTIKKIEKIVKTIYLHYFDNNEDYKIFNKEYFFDKNKTFKKISLKKMFAEIINNETNKYSKVFLSEKIRSLEIHFITKLKNNNKDTKNIEKYEQVYLDSKDVNKFKEEINDLDETKDYQCFFKKVKKLLKVKERDIFQKNVLKKILGIKILTKNNRDIFYVNNNMKTNLQNKVFQIKLDWGLIKDETNNMFDKNDDELIVNKLNEWFKELSKIYIKEKTRINNEIDSLLDVEKEIRKIILKSEKGITESSFNEVFKKDLLNWAKNFNNQNKNIKLMSTDQIFFNPVSEENNLKMELSDVLVIDKIKQKIYFIHLKARSGRSVYSNVFDQIKNSKNELENNSDSAQGKFEKYLDKINQHSLKYNLNFNEITIEEFKKFKKVFMVGLIVEENENDNSKINSFDIWYSTKDKKELEEYLWFKIYRS